MCLDSTCRCLSLFKSTCYARLNFYKRPTLVLVFSHWKKYEEGFCSHEKRQKAKQHSGFVLQPVVTQAGLCLSWEAGRVARQGPSFPRNYVRHLSIKPLSPPCLRASVPCVDVFSASINKMGPKVSEKPERGCFWGLGILKTFSV